MTDATFNNAATKNTGTKPRLSLLSSKQSGIRVRSDDQTDQQQQKTILSTSSTPDDYADSINVNSNNTTVKPVHQNPSIANVTETNKELTQQQQSLSQEKESQRVNGNTQNEESKMNISKEDLIRLLSMLKAELQSKEIALAAIKCEQLKRLINPVEISRSSLANTYIELQESFKLRDKNNNKNTGSPQDSSSASLTKDYQRNVSTTEKSTEQVQASDENDRESLNILNTLLELLDRHPLLALPRDSIYCLDYNCNELSTKNYLNLKIQHLDSLINQHRRFRYYMNERLKRSEQRYLDLTRELEIERNSKYENERLTYKTSGKSILLKHIDQLKEAFEKEKKDKQVIVMTLLNELLDERERADELAKKLANLESDSANSIAKNTGEKEKMLALETDFNLLSMQLKRQSMVFSKERNELQTRVTDLETENKNLKAKLEQQEKRFASSMSSKTTTSNLDTKDSNQTSPSSPQGRPTVASKHTGKSGSGSNVTTSVARGFVGPISNKSSPPPRSSASNSNSSGSPPARQGATSSSNGGLQSNISTSRQVNQNSSATTPSGQRTAAPPVVSRLLGGSSNTENPPLRIQPLFKSASVLSTNQQVRNFKTTTTSSGVSGSSTGGTSSSSGSNSANSNASISRISSTSNQPVTKPQVPAKPAQLLDQQRNSLN